MPLMVVISALLMQLCLGATYSWAVYVMHLRDLVSISQLHAQIPFTLFYFIFPATMIFSGSLLERFGPRYLTICGGFLFGSGWLISSLGGDNFLYTIIGNGFVAGIGAGIAYIVPISTCMKWFPNNKGLVTGIAVAGFGGGAALVSSGAGFLLDQGFTPFNLFGYFGIIFTLLILFAAIFMVNPPQIRYIASGITHKAGSIFRDRRFLILYFCMFTGLAAGFAVNANIKELYQSATLVTGVSAVSFFALANAAGRVIWGGLFDRLGTVQAIIINLMAQAGILFLTPVILKTGAGLQLFAILTGFNYGGVLVIYAGSVAKIWGAQRVASIYGWLFSANIPGAVAPLVAGYYFDKTGSFNLPLISLGVLITMAAATVYWQRRQINEP
ncbi:MFS transporter [Pelovirga terrestris]|uniref:MFS transporter n=1 Tax=Pelovirga terrestris TaxID=2771352 RepID=A0A8J6QJK5_9BACT|nr:MFS transporter [Pelovirga terrestris]MBD1399229.1 MFS transporter [Pelovirga terrestris]